MSKEDPSFSDRRRFLSLAASSAGAVGLVSAGIASAAPVDYSTRQPRRDEYDVIVIGGGFSGLVAARELSKSGVSTLLLEARNRIGGRTFTTTFQGDKIEVGGTWIHWSQPFVWSEIKRYKLGLAETPGAIADHASWIAAGRLKQGRSDKLFAAMNDGLAKYLDVDHQGGRSVMPLAHDPLARKDLLAPWDALSLQDRMDQMKFSRETRDLVAPFLEMNANNELRQGAFTEMLAWWARGDYDLGRLYDKLGRYKIKEGMGELATRMLQDSVADVLLSTPVKSVTKDGIGYLVTTSRGKAFRASAIVMAVPTDVLSSIHMEPGFNDIQQRMIREGQSCHGSKCYVHIRQKIGNWIAQAPYPNPVTLAFTERQRDDGTIVICFGPPGLLDISDEAAVQKAIRTLIPKAEVLAVTGYNWELDPYSRGTWTYYRPKQLTEGLAGFRAPVGGVFMAGAHLAEGWRGFVDGALETGITAAGDVRAYLKG